jgi:hypothetical protein
MALRDSKVIRFVGYSMFGLVVINFVLLIVLRVANGQGAEIYYGGRGLPIPNVAALVTIIAVGVVLVIWLGGIALRKLRSLDSHGKDV